MEAWKGKRYMTLNGGMEGEKIHELNGGMEGEKIHEIEWGYGRGKGT